MPVNIRRAVAIQEEKGRNKEPIRRFYRGVIVEYENSIYVPGEPEKVWVQEHNEDAAVPSKVLCRKVTPQAGLRVKIGWVTKPPYGVKEVLEEDLSDLIPGDTPSFSVPIHGVRHQYVNENNIGTDPVKIYQAAIQPLKSYLASGLIMETYPLVYASNGRYIYFPGQQTNLTSYLPGTSGYSVSVLLSLDRTTNTIAVTSGVEEPSVYDPEKPDIPDGHIPSCFVVLDYGQSVIDITTDYTDARTLLHIEGLQNTAINASQVGQILYSTDGLVFSAQLPMVNGAGLIVTTSDGIIMVAP